MPTTKEVGDRLENFTANALRAALAEDFDVLTKQMVQGREIDVLLSPKKRLNSPIFISCKNEKKKPAPDHIFNWAQVVQIGAASKGIVVATAGFTPLEIDFARNPERRIELWHCRPIRPEDLDVHGISVKGTLVTRPQILSADMAVKRPNGAEGEKGARTFQAYMDHENRDKWTYHTETGEVGNLWDDIHTAAFTVPPGPPQRIDLPTVPTKYFYHDRERVSLEKLSITVQRHALNLDFAVDFLREFPFVFENAVTGEISRLVPFNLHNL